MPRIRRKNKTWMEKVGRWTRPLHAPLVPIAGRLLFGALRRVPIGLVRPLARGLAAVVWPFAWMKVRARVDENLRIAFGDELDARGRRRLFRRAYSNQAVAIFETMAFARSADLVRRRISNWDEFGEALHSSLDFGRGVIVLSAHVGAWEMLGHACALHAQPFVAIAKRNQPAVDALLSRIRGAFGLRIHFHDASPRELLRTLQGGGGVGIIADRTFKRVASLNVPFFGRPSPFPKVPVTLAVKTGAPLLFVIVLPEADGRYRVNFDGPHLATGVLGPEEETRSLLSLWVAFVERTIRAMPEAWLPLAGHWKQRSEERRSEPREPSVGPVQPQRAES